MKILITVCARGGSKGIPGKNIKPISGYPLIYYTLKSAEYFKNNIGYHTEIVLSTDDEEIKKTVKKLGLDIFTDYTRPEYLASDTAGKIDAIVDVKKFMEEQSKRSYDYILDLDVTSPLRNFEDLKEAFELVWNDKSAYNIFSVSPANRNPYFNMVEQNNEGYYSLSKKGIFLSRQSAPNVYEVNASFYIYSKKFFDENYKSAITEKSLIYIVPHMCFDLDHPIDFDFMEYLLLNNKLDFNLDV